MRTRGAPGHGRRLDLRLEGNLYRCRRKIPPGLRKRIGKVEGVRSLGTGSASVAAARARELWLATEEILRRVTDDPTITRADIGRLVKEALGRALRRTGGTST